QMLSITMDNAYNNDTLTTKLGELIATFDGDSQRTRCFAHTLNLVAKAFLRLFE
ncbi:hypothetical protein BDZ89DRAFT_894175, partial [Hymenopellis radicata]